MANIYYNDDDGDGDGDDDDDDGNERINLLDTVHSMC